MLLSFLAVALLLPSPAPQSLDTDGDGLSDFDEVHKHRTDPERADSDGDGVPDGDWRERREHTYVVRAVVQVHRPVTPEHLTGDFQDARVLAEHEDRVELEVLLYPFATAPAELRGDPAWRERVARDPELARWLEPGPTADWDAELAAALRAELLADGIDVDALDDRALVEQASKWLLQRAEYVDSFTTFVTAFDERGEPYIPDELLAAVGDGEAPAPEAFEREISARGMFRHRTRGSCTSSAVYLTGCLRALGIPTRTVLAIPLFDAGDERQWELVRHGIREPAVRRAVLSGMAGHERSWTSHSFNEVFVGGRWWRLDYTELGVGILRPERFGLLVHVATFHDWADARMPESIGRRQSLNERDAIFRGANPYALLSVSEHLGEHASLELPEIEPLVAQVDAFYWTDDPGLDVDVRTGIERGKRFGLLGRLEGPRTMSKTLELLAAADLRLLLEAEDRPTLSAALDPLCVWWRGDHALVYVPFGPADRRDLVPGVEYSPRFRNDKEHARLEPADGLIVSRAHEER